MPVTPVATTAAFQAQSASLAAANNGGPVNLQLVPAGTAASATAAPAAPASPTGTTSAPGSNSSSQAAAALAASPDAGCGSGNALLSDLGWTWGNVAESFSEIPNATQAFQYSLTNTQTTTFGVGVSASGDPGSFSASGTFIFETDHTAEVNWPRENGATYNAWGTTFEIGLFSHFDTCNPANAYQFVEPYAWTTGERVTHPTSVPSLNGNNCRPFQSGGHFQANTSTASTIAHGYDVKGGSVVNLGFTGSAQTGYSANAQIGFDFNQDGSLCGNNAPPPFAGLYVAHA